MTKDSIIASVLTMSRKELEDAHITAGVMRWGEDERDGLARQATAKSLATLRMDQGMRLAEAVQLSRDDELTILEALTPAGDPVQYAALGALDDGLS